MYVLKTISVLIIISLTGCVNFSSQSTLKNAYITQIKVNQKSFLNRFTSFDVYHHGGKKIDSCLKKIDHFKRNNISTTVFSPCAYENELSSIWLNKSDFKYSLKHYFEVNISKIPFFFKEIGINENQQYNLQIILTPKNHTYYYRKSFWQLNDLTLLQGISIDLKNPNHNDIINTLTITTAHEYTHLLDISKGIIFSTLEYEKTAYLSSYCALVSLDNYKNKRPPFANIKLDFSYLEYLTRENISDEMLIKMLTLEEAVKGEKIKIEPTATDVAILSLEKDLYNLLDSYDNNRLNSSDKKQILEYCNLKLKAHFDELKL